MRMAPPTGLEPSATCRNVRCSKANLRHGRKVRPCASLWSAQGVGVFKYSGGKEQNKNPRRLPRALLDFQPCLHTLGLEPSATFRRKRLKGKAASSFPPVRNKLRACCLYASNTIREPKQKPEANASGFIGFPAVLASFGT